MTFRNPDVKVGDGVPCCHVAVPEMFHSVVTERYHGLSRFEMGGLGRVNLLVGKDNCGKTSALEALHVLAADTFVFDVIAGICLRRGEGNFDRPHPFAEAQADISHMFPGHQLRVDASFAVRGVNATAGRGVSVSIGRSSADGRGEDPQPLPPLRLEVRGSGDSVLWENLTETNRMGLDAKLRVARWVNSKTEIDNTEINAHFIPPDSVDRGGLGRLWDEVQLTSREDRVLEAVRLVDPAIRDRRTVGIIGAMGESQTRFIVKRDGTNHRIPLGSLGDGVRRLLGLVIVKTQCEGGMLLVDEIDTGLHHSVMADMWRLIRGTAEKLDIQVFATMHSLDCVHSLAAICHAEAGTPSDVSIERIERDRIKAVPFSEQEMRIVAERRIEIR